MEISIKTNFPEIQRKLDNIGKQAKFALAFALTRTAQDVRKDLRQEMRRVFDRPTPYTLNSLYLDRATKTNLVAKVFFKDDFGTKAHYLMPQIEGGNRPQKRFEQRLVKLGLMPPGWRSVPGAGAQLDRYGNMSRGQIVKILSQLRSAGFSGDFSIKTNSKRSKAKRKNEYYFGSTGPGGTIQLIDTKAGKQFGRTSGRTHNLARGVWVRTGNSVKPVLLFVSAATYRRRFDFFAVGKASADKHFPTHANAAIKHALATAK